MSSIERVCANPGCDKTGIHLCSACGEEIYCSKTCQKDHWLAHKTLCQSALRPRATVGLTNSFEELSVKQLKNVFKMKVGSYELTKRNKLLEQLENIIEKPALVAFVSKYVKVSEVETLLAVPESSSQAQHAQSKPKQTTPKKSSTTTATNNQHRNHNPYVNQGQGQQPTPTPDQLLQQAKMMRQNPDMVRRSNPMMANFSNEQIQEYAKQLEVAATDPAMMGEIAKMSRMPQSDRARIQNLQEGISGVCAMDSKWVAYTVETLKSHSDLIKNMMHGKGPALGGFTDQQIDSFIDGVRSIDAYYLKHVISFLLYMGALSKPIIAMWKTIDKATLGLANYALLFLFLVIMYYIGSFWWMVAVKIFMFFSPVKAAAAATAASVTGATAGVVGSGIGATAAATPATGFKAVVGRTTAAVTGAVLSLLNMKPQPPAAVTHHSSSSGGNKASSGSKEDEF